MSQIENSFTFLAQLRENFCHNCTKLTMLGLGLGLTMFVFVKSMKVCFQRGSFNDKHVTLSLLKDLYSFKSF